MKLKILLPAEIFIDQEVTKVAAEAENGCFCLLPRHADFVTALVPGLLSFVSKAGKEEFIAVDEGILIKAGPEVLVSTRNAIGGLDLGTLRRTIEGQFEALSDQEKKARSVLANIEASFVRRFLKLK
ncbi:MAG: F0F1 ATP synthase subunit epsilon [Candidatus Jettenia sp.]|nr:MAG: F0F1 ATP synthase subunit epsilon [Candidatus Jettenia sp.]